ncbi:30S ribosomal protein S13 [Candidatus Woesearchaeota archaeon]|nr:30S ribosomal protein S13 [Candidatus Woesearchaeota archaeon]
MAEEKPRQKKEAVPEEKEGFSYIVRIANTDLDGNKPIGFALKKIRGVGYSIANAVCKTAGVDMSKRVGYLDQKEIEKINTVIENPAKFNFPAWAFNRRKDPETGEDQHLLLGDLQFAKENDIKMLKKMKSYRGSRHMAGLPVRGQRTKSNFRKSKSRGKGGIGVQKKKAGKK